jgi:exodeoxyribonuclease V alpha subunit
MRWLSSQLPSWPPHQLASRPLAGTKPHRSVGLPGPIEKGGCDRAQNEKPFVERFGYIYRPGDKVMQIENDYDKETYNGDLGLVESVDPDAQEMTISFDGREVVYQFGELDQVSLAYATSIHKSQGSEYPAVVIPIAMQHYMMLKRNLIYTGITRGKRLVVLVGQRKALAIAVRGQQVDRRWSKLREWLG